MEEKLFKIITGKKQHPVALNSILYCEARRVRTLVHLIDGTELLHDRNLGSMLKDSGYDPCLMKSHKSVIINLRQVVCLDCSKKEKMVVLKGKIRQPISRRMYRFLDKALFQTPR